MPTSLSLLHHAQRSAELQRLAAHARLVAAARDARRARRLAARAAVLAAHTPRLPRPRPSRD